MPVKLNNYNITFNLQGSKNGVRRKSISEVETHCIALGTSNGKVLLYSVSQAKIETVLTDSNNNRVLTLDWHKKYGMFSCTSDNYVQEWDLQSSKVKNKYSINVTSTIKQGNKVSAIRIVPHNQVNIFKFFFFLIFLSSHLL